jgi:hypothetical protein
MKRQPLTSAAELSDLFDRIQQLEIKFMRNRCGRMVADLEIHTSFGDFCPDDGHGGMTSVEMSLLSRLLTKACESTGVDDDEGDETPVADVLRSIDLDDEDDGDIPVPLE